MSSSLLEELRERFPRVAVVHDWITVPGGSELVVLELLEMFPQADLFTAIYDRSAWPQHFAHRQIRTSYLDRVPGAARHYQKLLPFVTRALCSFDLSHYDLVISSSHACAKNVRTPGVPHVCYCHTPMRYAWDEGLLAGEQVGPLLRLALPLLLGYLRRQDLAGADAPDVFVANSRHVAARIERHYGRSSEVVNPPVDVAHYLTLPRAEEDYYLVFGRVVPYKRVDLAVAACNQLMRPLRIAGGGRAVQAVRAGAGGDGDVEFLGLVDDAQRDALLTGARALLFPGEEDFGMVPVEAQAAGVPVIAYGVGGACETVVDGRTGVLFDEQTPAALAAAIERFETLSLDGQILRENARRYGRERFRAEMAEVIDRAVRATPPGRI
jgi:glycosyltransferase involved in cell wall biosynthesis